MGQGLGSKIPRIHVEFKRRQVKINFQLVKSKLNLEGSRHPALVRGVQVLMTSEAGFEVGEGKVIQPQEVMGCVGRHVGTSDFPNAWREKGFSHI